MFFFAVPGFVCLFLLMGFAACNPTTAPYSDGEKAYKKVCANCHMDDGTGLGELIPPLAGADFLKNNRAQLPCVLKFGLSDTIMVNGKQYAEAMAGLPFLSDVDITNILNYINHQWGNEQPVFQLQEVQKGLKDCGKEQ